MTLIPEALELIGDVYGEFTDEYYFDPYQWWMSTLLVENEIVLLGAFMGSGKTAVVLHAFRRLRADRQVKTMLVVAPLKVAEETWPHEIGKWEFAKGFRYSLVLGNEVERIEALKRRADIYIINRENIQWLWKRLAGVSRKFDVLTYDEASRLKSGKKLTPGRKTAAGGYTGRKLTEFGSLARMRPRFARVWELSGTPTPNGLVDLWGPSYILDGGARLGMTREAFIERWFESNVYAHTVTPRSFAEPQIMDRLKDIFFFLKDEDYIDLPDLQVVDRWVSLGKKEQAMYDEFERESCLEELDVEAVNNAVLCNKLLQFANGSVYAQEDDDDLLLSGLQIDLRRKSVAKYVHNRKLIELESVLEEAAGRSVLIAYSFRFDVQAIVKRFPWVRVFGQSKTDVRDWNAGKIRAMVLHPASAGHGLNLQEGGNLAVWYGLNWSLELYLQFNRRLLRRGQRESFVRLYRILARDTNDERVADVLEAKDATQDSITDRVRVYAEQIQREWRDAA